MLACVGPPHRGASRPRHRSAICYPSQDDAEQWEICLNRGRDAAYAEPLAHGSLVKLYNYQIEFPSAIVFDLNYELSGLT
jgi:hypothetical protein